MTQRSKAPVELREIDNLPGFQTCLKLQHETWGKGFTDQVSPSVLMIAQRTGGLVLGAFVHGRMVGFAWGISGWKGSKRIHWSDMLAVKRAFRGRGIGYQLKLKQREILKQRGVAEIYWTFDPLQALNAHFNFAKLGIVVREYRPNLYGKTDSPLHAGLDTDRFVATWDLRKPLKRHVESEVTIDPHRLLNPDLIRTSNEPVHPSLRLNLKKKSKTLLYLEMPSNLSELRTQNMGLAQQWQLSIRAACLHYFSKGFMITDCVQGKLNNRKGFFYVLQK